MNENHHDDSMILDQIDGMLERGRATDDDLINALASTRPTADRGFQAQLEEILLARLQPQHAGQGSLNVVSQPQPGAAGIARRPSHVPMTWAATLAAVALALVSLIVINLNREAAFGRTAESGTAAALSPAAPTATCPSRRALGGCLPDGMTYIGLPLASDTLQGLKVGDRVDVLASVDGRIRVIVADIMVDGISPSVVMFAAQDWKAGVLIGFYQTGDSFALRLHTGSVPPVLDDTPQDLTISLPEPMPADYTFDLVVNLPVEKGYLLTDLPASIDAVKFTANDDTLQFWFTNLEVVHHADDGMSVTIRLPQADAVNLEYLIGVGAGLTFQPDAE